MSKILVAYFSASGVTKKVAEKLAKIQDADLFEICPQVPYTKEDLDWTDKQSRSSVEMQDLNCRPPITGQVQDMAQYDIVYIGFPVWWYREPSIIDTFLDAYDFTGKKLVPFCTSGTSGLGDTVKRIQELVGPGAVVVEGKRLEGTVSEEALKAWATEL